MEVEFRGRKRAAAAYSLVIFMTGVPNAVSMALGVLYGMGGGNMMCNWAMQLGVDSATKHTGMVL